MNKNNLNVFYNFVKCLPAIISFVLPLNIMAQTPELIGPPGDFPYALFIHPTDHSKIYGSNYYGGLFYSIDGSQSEIIENGNMKVNQIYVSPLTGDMFVYTRSLFARKKYLTDQWELIYDDNGYPPIISQFCVNPVNSEIMYMHRYGSEIWRSNDGGDSWHFIHKFEGNFEKMAIAPSDTSVLYAAAGANLYKTKDSGNNWFKLLADSIRISFDQIVINPRNSNTLFIKGNNRLYRVRNSVIDTAGIYDPVNFIIDPVDTTIMYASKNDSLFGTGEGLYKSVDAGDTWSHYPTEGLPYQGATINVSIINPSDPKIIYGTVPRFGVFKTTNGGSNWEVTNIVCEGSNSLGYEIINGNRGEVICVSDGWNIIKTKDMGKTWYKPKVEPQESKSFHYYFSTLSFNPEDKNEGLFIDGTRLYKTTDAGDSWYETERFNNCTGVKYHDFNPNIIYVSSIEEGYIAKHITFDGGISWSIKPSYSPHLFSSIEENIGYTYQPGHVLKTTDFGQTWATKDSGLKIQTDRKVAYIKDLAISESNPNVLYSCQYNLFNLTELIKAVSKSTDGGENWFSIDSSLYLVDPNFRPKSLMVDPENPDRLFLGLEQNGIFYEDDYSPGGLYLTENGGKDWKKLFSGTVNRIKLDDSSPKNIYFHTNYGIIRLPDTAKVTGIIRTSQFPQEFYLSQNYPNPFNPSTIIEYNIPSASQAGNLNNNITLKVYNIVGREVATIVNKSQKPGNYKVKFNGAGLASGIYYYRLVSGEKYVSTKKMIYLK
ncbi:MAG: hypothetical protein CVV23_10985 [Ignavibacteriae bacterium HGW-Ignavibacteriae-2]|jgi:photosystem II stability/assembly factor-like uncharacterized protein|nr:MAG: hypothetical protein CVV23_10985 [Ignavibacteriae bacterium HGW-Ignavibacteriae-2]